MAEMYVDHPVVERRFDAGLVAQLQLQELSLTVVHVGEALVCDGHRHGPLQLAGPFSLSAHRPDGHSRRVEDADPVLEGLQADACRPPGVSPEADSSRSLEWGPVWCARCALHWESEERYGSTS